MAVAVVAILKQLGLREQIIIYLVFLAQALFAAGANLNPFGTGAPADHFFEQTGQQLLALSRG